MWACGYAGMWVGGQAGIQACNMWTCGYSGMQEYWHEGMQICGHVSTWLCRYESAQVRGHLGICACGCVGMQVCGYAGMQDVGMFKRRKNKVYKKNPNEGTESHLQLSYYLVSLSHSAENNSTSNKTTPSSVALQTSLTPSRLLAEVDGLHATG